MNTCKDKRRREIEHVLKYHLEKFDIQPSILVEPFASICQITDAVKIR